MIEIAFYPHGGYLGNSNLWDWRVLIPKVEQIRLTVIWENKGPNLQTFFLNPWLTTLLQNRTLKVRCLSIRRWRKDTCHVWCQYSWLKRELWHRGKSQCTWCSGLCLWGRLAAPVYTVRRERAKRERERGTDAVKIFMGVTAGKIDCSFRWDTALRERQREWAVIFQRSSHARSKLKTIHKSIKSPGISWCTVMPFKTTSVINHTATLSWCTCPPVSSDELCCPAAPTYMSVQQETALDWTLLII